MKMSMTVQVAYQLYRKDLVVNWLKEQVPEIAMTESCKEMFVTNFNLGVRNEPELVMTEKDYDYYLREAYGLASHGSAA